MTAASVYDPGAMAVDEGGTVTRGFLFAGDWGLVKQQDFGSGT